MYLRCIHLVPCCGGVGRAFGLCITRVRHARTALIADFNNRARLAAVIATRGQICPIACYGLETSSIQVPDNLPLSFALGDTAISGGNFISRFSPLSTVRTELLVL
jgi:hypothetical protein